MPVVSTLRLWQRYTCYWRRHQKLFRDWKLIMMTSSNGNIWKHFSRYWPIVREIHRCPMDSHHKGQWRGALMFSLMCAWTNGWANNGNAGALRPHSAHYDVVVMFPVFIGTNRITYYTCSWIDAVGKTVVPRWKNMLLLHLREFSIITLTQQDINCAKADRNLCRHITSLRHQELFSQHWLCIILSLHRIYGTWQYPMTLGMQFDMHLMSTSLPY